MICLISVELLQVINNTADTTRRMRHADLSQTCLSWLLSGSAFCAALVSAGAVVTVTTSQGENSAEDIDRTMSLGVTISVGPLELADIIGLDACPAALRVLHSELGD